MSKGKKKFKFLPEFRPRVIQVVCKQDGFDYVLPIIQVHYDEDFMRIICINNLKNKEKK